MDRISIVCCSIIDKAGGREDSQPSGHASTSLAIQARIASSGAGHHFLRTRSSSSAQEPLRVHTMRFLAEQIAVGCQAHGVWIEDSYGELSSREFVSAKESIDFGRPSLGSLPDHGSNTAYLLSVRRCFDGPTPPGRRGGPQTVSPVTVECRTDSAISIVEGLRVAGYWDCGGKPLTSALGLQDEDIPAA